MFPQVKKDNPHGLPMYPEGKINARSILATVTEAKHHVLSIVQANKKLKQVSFKKLVNLTDHQKEACKLILDEWEKGTKCMGLMSSDTPQ